MTKEQSAAFEEAWKNIKAPANETITSKWYFMQGCKAALSIAERKPDAVPQFKWKIGHVEQPDKQTGIIRATVVEGEKDPKRKIGIFEIKDAELICVAIARLRLPEFYKQDAGAGEEII